MKPLFTLLLAMLASFDSYAQGRTLIIKNVQSIIGLDTLKSGLTNAIRLVPNSAPALVMIIPEDNEWAMLLAQLKNVQTDDEDSRKHTFLLSLDMTLSVKGEKGMKHLELVLGSNETLTTTVTEQFLIGPKDGARNATLSFLIEL